MLKLFFFFQKKWCQEQSYHKNDKKEKCGIKWEFLEVMEYDFPTSVNDFLSNDFMVFI